jgi:hypothetical protein
LIRAIAPDELEWFLASALGFLGHSDPRTFARRAALLLDRTKEAERSFILLDKEERPRAGAYVLAPEPEDDDQNLIISSIWFSESADDLTKLLGELMERHPHEAARCPLHNFSPEHVARITPAFERLGFSLFHAHDLEFSLADTPPLGLPLMLEAYTEEADHLFRKTFARCEGFEPKDAFWAWLKRWRGKFNPDLWWLARQTPDQEPVGYAFFGALDGGVEGGYYLTAAGVLAEHRQDSEMLRRLIISSLQELASLSPFGRIETTVTRSDPKLVRILELIGFALKDHYPVFAKEPG